MASLNPTILYTLMLIGILNTSLTLTIIITTHCNKKLCLFVLSVVILITASTKSYNLFNFGSYWAQPVILSVSLNSEVIKHMHRAAVLSYLHTTGKGICESVGAWTEVLRKPLISFQLEMCLNKSSEIVDKEIEKIHSHYF